MGWIERTLIDQMEAATGWNADYLRDLERASPASIWKFLMIQPLTRHRRHVEKEVLHVARLAATRAEDCGPCLQICVNLALQDGVAQDLLRTALDAPDMLEPDLAIAYRYGMLVASNDPDAGDGVDAARTRFGDAGLADLALAVAMVRVFPTLKRGLGHGQSCALVQVTLP